MHKVTTRILNSYSQFGIRTIRKENTSLDGKLIMLTTQEC